MPSVRNLRLEIIYPRQIKRCEQVVDCLAAADFFYCAVFAEKKLATAQFSVVVESHCSAMRSGIMDNYQVAHVDFWKFALNGKFVAIFTKGADYIVNVVARGVFFA